MLNLIRYLGYPLIVIGVAAENLGLPIPGELLVLLAGSALAQGDFSTGGIIIAAALGASTGDHLSYFMGRKAGPRIMDLYCRLTLCSTHCSSLVGRFYRRYGAATLLFARYLIGVRALAAPAAGMSGVSYPRFAVFDLAGSLLWASLVTLIGRFFGRKLLPWMAGSHAFGAVISTTLLLIILAVILYKLRKVKKYGRAQLAGQPLRTAQSDSHGGGSLDGIAEAGSAPPPEHSRHEMRAAFYFALGLLPWVRSSAAA